MLLIIEFSLLIGAALGAIHFIGDAVIEDEYNRKQREAHDREQDKRYRTLKSRDKKQSNEDN